MLPKLKQVLLLSIEVNVLVIHKPALQNEAFLLPFITGKAVKLLTTAEEQL